MRRIYLFVFLLAFMSLLSVVCLFFCAPGNNSHNDKYFFPKSITSLSQISGDFHYHTGEILYLDPLSERITFPFDDPPRLYSFNVSHARKDHRYSEPYRFHIDTNGGVNMYKFYSFAYSTLSKVFDISDEFCFMLAVTEIYNSDHRSKHNYIRLSNYFDDGCRSREILYFFSLKDDSKIVGGNYWDNNSSYTLGLDRGKNASFPIKDNLVLYDELDSAKEGDVIVLSIADLGFDSIPKKLKNFSNIKKLFMPFNKVKFTDADWEVLESLSNLEVLDIRGNEIASSADPNLSRLKNLKSLKKLYMAGKNVLQNGKLPSGIYDIEGLETLSVGELGDVEISQELTKLKNLKALRLYLSSIKNFPPESLRKITRYYKCTFDSKIPINSLRKIEYFNSLKLWTLSEILMHEEG